MEPDEKMSLGQLYEIFYKLNSDRDAIDMKIKAAKRLIAKKEKSVTEDDQENQSEEDSENESEAEVEEEEHDDVPQPQRKRNKPNEVQPKINREKDDHNLIDGHSLQVIVAEPDVEEDAHTNVPQPETNRRDTAFEDDPVIVAEPEVGEEEHTNVPQVESNRIELVNVESEIKRKEPDYESGDEIDAGNKKARTVVEAEYICTLWDTQFMEQVNNLVDSVVRSAQKTKHEKAIPVITRETVEELPNARPIREHRQKGVLIRTPFTDQEVAKKKKIIRYSKKRPSKKAITNQEVQVFDQRPDDFVDAPPREDHRDLSITVERNQAALNCYEAMTLEQKKIIVLYSLDNKLKDSHDGEFVVFDKTTYLSREDIASLRPRQWLSSAVVDTYYRSKLKQIHNTGLFLDRMVFAGHVMNNLFEFQLPDATQMDNILAADSEQSALLRTYVEESYPFVTPYLHDIPYLMVPHCDNQHFTVYIIDTISAGGFILDSWKDIGQERRMLLLGRGSQVQYAVAFFAKQLMGGRTSLNTNGHYCVAIQHKMIISVADYSLACS